MGTYTKRLAGAGRKVHLLLSSSLLALMLVALATEPSVGAQLATGKALATERPQKQWEIDAGGKMEFDVASIKQDTAQPSPTTVHSNVPMGSMDLFAPTGGLFTATNWPLLQYLIFAYKFTPAQDRSINSELPKWALDNRYDIQARASGNPTKDQYRLMMQALLADRFKLAFHFETKQVPVFALLLDKPGKLGPQLRVHPENAPCSVAPPGPTETPATIAGGYPESCGALIGAPSSTNPGRITIGARNVPFSVLVDNLFQRQIMGVDRPVLDKTGLSSSDRYDFTIEFTPVFNGPLPPGSTFQPDANGPTFNEALKEQLGLKLEPQTGPTDVVVIDHIEQPSEN